MVYKPLSASIYFLLVIRIDKKISHSVIMAYLKIFKYIMLFIEQISDPRSRISGIIGVVCTAAARAVFGADQLVIPAMVLVLAVLLIGRKKL